MRLDKCIVSNGALDLFCSFLSFYSSLFLLELRPISERNFRSQTTFSLEIKYFEIGCRAKKIFQLLGQYVIKKFQLLGALAVGRYTRADMQNASIKYFHRKLLLLPQNTSIEYFHHFYYFYLFNQTNYSMLQINIENLTSRLSLGHKNFQDTDWGWLPLKFLLPYAAGYYHMLKIPHCTEQSVMFCTALDCVTWLQQATTVFGNTTWNYTAQYCPGQHWTAIPGYSKQQLYLKTPLGSTLHSTALNSAGLHYLAMARYNFSALPLNSSCRAVSMSVPSRCLLYS